MAIIFYQITINERIQQIIKHLELNNNSFSKQIEVNPTVIHNIIKGRNAPSYDILNKISLSFDNIYPTWLLTGKGEMLVGGKKYADLSENTHLNMASDHKPAYNSDLVAYLERKLDEKTRECYDLQAKIEGLACELRRRKEAPAEEHPLADVG